MKNASEIMHKIGRIFNIIAIPVFAVLIVVGLIMMIVGAAGAAAATTEADQVAALATVSSGTSMMVTCIIFLVFEIIALVICTKKKAEIDNGSNEVAPRVFLIVFGAISENVFYVLCGIFSLIARSQEQNAQQNTQQE